MLLERVTGPYTSNCGSKAPRLQSLKYCFTLLIFMRTVLPVLSPAAVGAPFAFRYDLNTSLQFLSQNFRSRYSAKITSTFGLPVHGKKGGLDVGMTLAFRLLIFLVVLLLKAPLSCAFIASISSALRCPCSWASRPVELISPFSSILAMK